MKKKNIVRNWIVAAAVVLCLFAIYVKKSDSECVGYYIGDFEVEPIIVQNEVYFPNPAYPGYPYDDDWDRNKDSKVLGNIKNQSLYEKMGKMKNPLYYMGYFLINQVWVDNRYAENEHLIVNGGFFNEYSKASYLEETDRTQQIIENYSNYILISKEHTSKNQCIIPKELVVELEEFGECSYDVKDFEEMVEAYYVTTNAYFEDGCTNEELRAELAKDLPRRGHYIGTIFVDDDGNLYYCNRNNLINEEMTRRIYAILEEGNMLEK